MRGAVAEVVGREREENGADERAGPGTAQRARFRPAGRCAQELLQNKRYRDTGDFTIDGLANRLVGDFGERSLDIVIHSLANGPEVKKPLMETSRSGYLTALGVSAYSQVAMVNRLSPLMREGGSFLSLTYMASERVIPGYGGGMSSAKAALESDTRVLAYEAGRKYGVRVNCISAGPLASRAASAIGIIEQMVSYASANSPLTEPLTAAEVASADYRIDGVRRQGIPLDGNGRRPPLNRLRPEHPSGRLLVV